MNKRIIAVIEDEEAIRIGLCDSLSTEGYNVISASNGTDGEVVILHEKPDLVLLDVMMPGQDGVSVCKNVRSKGYRGFIIMLTAKKEELDRVTGLHAGADDYMVKPFSLMELVAKIKAMFRRLNDSADNLGRIKVGGLEIDIKKREVKINGTVVDLPGKEFDIMKYLAEHYDEVVSRDSLLNAIWGYDVFPTTRTVDNFMVRLRQKLDTSNKNALIIKSIRGVGYKFCPGEM